MRGPLAFGDPSELSGKTGIIAKNGDGRALACEAQKPWHFAVLA